MLRSRTLTVITYAKLNVHKMARVLKLTVIVNAIKCRVDVSSFGSISILLIFVTDV